MSKTIHRIISWAGASTLAAAAIASALQSGPASATPGAAATAAPSLTARTILSGKAHGWTAPDDLAAVGPHLFVGFQNGVPSTGGTTGTHQKSTLVEFRSSGHIERHVNLVGKIDGMGADPAHHRVIVTVNEDGNSSLYTVTTTGVVRHFTYDRSPLPHGGGTDAVDVYKGNIYLSASNPSKKAGPAIYRVTLSGSTAHIAGAPFRDDSTAKIANIGRTGRVTLALTDPDSNTTVPTTAHRFAGDFMLDSQGDQEAIFASRLGTRRQFLQVLTLSQSVDDTAFASRKGGMFVTTDANADSVLVITGAISAGAEYTVVTPGNANNAPANAGPNYFGTINLRSGRVTSVRTRGTSFQPHGLIYIP